MAESGKLRKKTVSSSSDPRGGGNGRKQLPDQAAHSGRQRFQLTLPWKSDTMKIVEIMRFIREKKKGEKSGEDFGKEICVTD